MSLRVVFECHACGREWRAAVAPGKSMASLPDCECGSLYYEWLSFENRDPAAVLPYDALDVKPEDVVLNREWEHDPKVCARWAGRLKVRRPTGREASGGAWSAT